MTWYSFFLDLLFPQVQITPLAATPSVAFCCPVCRGRIPLYFSGVPPRIKWCHPKADYLLVTATHYRDAGVQDMVRSLKFRRLTAVAAEFGRAAFVTVMPFAALPDCVLPIPLSHQRMRERGFNQAELIAQEVAARLKRPCLSDVILRTRHTAPQSATKSWQERAQNLRDSFAVPAPELVRGKTILLVDDVWTSGATMGGAAKALRLAGAGLIIGFAVAQAG